MSRSNVALDDRLGVGQRVKGIKGTLFILEGTLNRRKQRELLQFIDLLPKTKPGNTEMSFHASQNQENRPDFNNMMCFTVLESKEACLQLHLDTR